MENDYKMVDFHTHCEKCEHADKKDYEDPCNECLGHPTNLYSVVPVNYKEAQKKVRKEEPSNE